MTEELKPCPFCGSEGRETRFDDTGHWTGMRSQHISTSMKHFCTKPDDDNFVDTSIQIRGRDKADCIARWNARWEAS